jgi:hypothetical protein
VRDLFTLAVYALAVYDLIQQRDRRFHMKAVIRISPKPALLEMDSRFTTTLETRPVPGSKRGDFVQKEKLCPAPRGHHCPLSIFELQHTGDPSLVAEGPCDFMVRMYNATIAHPQAPRRCPDKFPKGVNAILKHP